MGIKKYVNPKNVAAIAAAPFTAGASLALLNDGDNTILDHVTGAASAKKANEQQMALQRETNQMSIELANTAHQREVADLEAAHLNPILSAGGSGAAVPTLGTAQVQNTMPGGLMGQATQAANIIGTIASAKQAASAAELQNAQAENIPSQTLLNQSEAGKNNAEILRIAKENGYTDEKIKNAIEERNLIIAQANKATSEKDLIEAQNKIKKWEGEHPYLINLWSPMATAVAGGIAGGVSGGMVSGIMGGINSAKQHKYKMSEKSLQLNSGGIDPRSLGIGL